MRATLSMRLLLAASLATATGAGAAERRRDRRCDARPVAVAMREVAAHVARDPLGDWSDFELWNPNTPAETSIRAGEATLCDGSRLVVTQIVNRQCASPTSCPARVRRHAGGRVATALDYRQICTDGARVAASADGDWLIACDVALRLAR